MISSNFTPHRRSSKTKECFYYMSKVNVAKFRKLMTTKLLVWNLANRRCVLSYKLSEGKEYRSSVILFLE